MSGGGGGIFDAAIPPPPGKRLEYKSCGVSLTVWLDIGVISIIGVVEISCVVLTSYGGISSVVFVSVGGRAEITEAGLVMAIFLTVDLAAGLTPELSAGIFLIGRFSGADFGLLSTCQVDKFGNVGLSVSITAAVLLEFLPAKDFATNATPEAAALATLMVALPMAFNVL